MGEIFFFPLIFFLCRVVSCADSWHCKRSVLSVVYSPDGKRVASGSRDRSVRILETSTGTCVSTLTGDRGILCVSFSPNSNILAAGDYGSKIRLYDPETGEVKTTLTGHSDP